VIDWTSIYSLALGARAIFVGCPGLWELAVAGQAVVRRVLATLQHEFDTALALCGCALDADIRLDLLDADQQGSPGAGGDICFKWIET